MYVILEFLDVCDLLNVAQIDERFSSLAAEEFRHRYSHLSVVVRNDLQLPYELEEALKDSKKTNTDAVERIAEELSHDPELRPYIQVDDFYIELHNFDAILITFKYFGHVIKAIVSEPVEWNVVMQTELISYLISKYSSESLVSIALRRTDDELLQHITKPLINLKSVTMKECDFILRRRPAKLSFCALFPAVRDLNLDIYRDHDYNYFDCHMPHLEHVNMVRYAESTKFPNFIRKNPQIRSIAVQGKSKFNTKPDHGFIKSISELLPQLETFTLKDYQIDESIRFENVVEFDTGYASDTSPANLHFSRLQKLHISHSSAHFDECLTFLKEHNYLRHLHLIVKKLDDSQFQQITENCANLEEITLEHISHEGLSCDAILEFLRNHAKVKQLNLINSPEQYKIELQERLEHQWNVKTIKDGLSFKLR